MYKDVTKRLMPVLYRTNERNKKQMCHLKCSLEKDCLTVNPNVYGESQSLIEIDKMSLYTTLQEDMDTRMVRRVIAADKITTRN